MSEQGESWFYSSMEISLDLIMHEIGSVDNTN